MENKSLQAAKEYADFTGEPIWFAIRAFLAGVAYASQNTIAFKEIADAAKAIQKELKNSHAGDFR